VTPNPPALAGLSGPSGGPAAPAEAREVEGGWAVVALFAFALVVGAYFTFRFGGRWAEWDTASQADAIRSMLRMRTILPNEGSLYPNGYMFGAVSTFILALTGLETATLLQALYPLVSATLVIIAWPLYRELTGSGKGATLATLLLFIQPEFLFVILRGSHERVLRALLFLSLFVLVRSFRFAGRTRAYSAYVFLFYLSVYGTIATNSLFGSSYVWALAVALTGSWVAGYFGPGLKAVSQRLQKRLIYVPLTCVVLAFVFNSFIYPPAGNGLTQLPDIYDRLTRLLLTTNPETNQGKIVAYNPYAAVVDSWIDVKVYFLVSIGTYVLLLSSAFVWIRTGLHWLAGKGDPPTLGRWLLWLLYSAFMAQGLLSIVADRAGMLGGNLQYRSFPSFVMVATPMLAVALVDWRPSHRLRVLGAMGLGVLTFLAILKATNEPGISNKWTFYLPAEAASLRFADQHLTDAGLWTDIDERLRATQLLILPRGVDTYITLDPSIRAYLITDTLRLRAARLGKALPPVSGEHRVYDNGGAQIYRTRPQTPYQN
jgi:hypothetical protein